MVELTVLYFCLSSKHLNFAPEIYLFQSTLVIYGQIFGHLNTFIFKNDEPRIILPRNVGNQKRLNNATQSARN